MSDEKSDKNVIRLGQHLPIATRRVVAFVGEWAKYQTAIGMVEGLADGVVLVRDFAKGTHYELTIEQVRAIQKALSYAACAVQQWQERASGFHKIRVARSPSGEVTVSCRGRTRPMRLSKLRGSRHDGRLYRRCAECTKITPTLYVAADDLRENGERVHHVEVCPDCVEQLANIPEPRAQVVTQR